MAINKKNHFNENDLKLADFAKSLSHPARIKILKTLAQKNTCICGEIVDVMPLAQSTVSQHLNDLKKLGLIVGEIDGPRSCYCIDWERFKELSDLLNEFINELMDISQNCCD